MTATAPTRAPDVSGTTNGTTTWYTYQTSPTASQMELADATAFASKITALEGSGGAGSANVTAAAISAAAAVGGTLLTGALAGSSIANTVLSNQRQKSQQNSPQPAPQGEVQIVFANKSSVPLALDSVKGGTGCSVSNVPDTLTTGQSDVLVLTNPSQIDGSAQLEINLKIGNGASLGGSTYSSISVGLYLNYSASNTLWIMTPSVDGSTGMPPSPTAVATCSCTFAAADASQYPSFSFYFTPVQTGSGSMSFSFYDH